MAKKKKENIGDNISDKDLREERRKVVFGILLLFTALFFFIAFISYLFTWKADQCFTWENIFTVSDLNARNWAGKTGARLSFMFMNKWFGLSSILLPLILVVLGLRLLNVRRYSFWKTFINIIILTVLVSVILGYIFGHAEGYLGSGPGGGHGYYISQWLNSLLGVTGTGLVLLLLVLSYLTYTFKNFSKKITGIIHKIFNRDKPNDQKEEEKKSENISPTDVFTEDITKQLSNEGIEVVFHETNHEIKSREGQKMEETEEYDKVDTDDFSLEIEEKEKEEEIELSSDVLSEQGPYDPKLDLSYYKYPTVELLEDHHSGSPEVTQEELISNKNKIVETLKNYKIDISHIKATIGPTVTLYEIIPAPGIRISKIKSLEDDIALSLSALGIRIIAPIPGRGTIGIEVPNRNPEIVSMKSVIINKKFIESNADLSIVLGKTISNETYVVDLAKMPHILIAGATGQGKSVGLNAIIISLLYKKHPSELKFVLIDPKKVELTLYGKLEKHFLAKLPDVEEPIITDTQKVINTLNSLTIEMDMRYNLLKKAHVRNIKEYNIKFKERKLNPEHGHRYLPYIVVIIDEFADLIMTAGREIETPLARIAQLARAIGIHLIIATQRPTTNIITGVIKANFPARIAFRVTSMIDSRTILDCNGANQLIGRGDMLVSTGNELIRVQCAYIDTQEIERIVDYISQQQGYSSAFYLPEVQNESSDSISNMDFNARDELFEEAARLVVMYQQGSTSLIQRKFSIGYNRAGRIMDQLEKAGIVGPSEGSKARQVLIVDEQSLEQILRKFDV